MKDSEALVYYLLGLSGKPARSLIDAIELASDLLFVKKLHPDAIFLIKHICTPIAEKLQVKPATVARNIERAIDLCNTKVPSEIMRQIIGRNIVGLEPKYIVLYLAYYVKYKKSFFDITRDSYSLPSF